MGNTLGIFTAGLLGGNPRQQEQERQAQLANITNAGLSPEQQAEAIKTLYQKDPSALKQHIENLFRRMAGKQAQSTPDAYPAELPSGPAPQVGQPVEVGQPAARTQADKRAQILSGAPGKQSSGALKFGTFDIPGAALVAGGVTTDALGGQIDPKQTYRERDVGGKTGYVPSTAKASNARPVPYYAGAVNLETAASMQQQNGMEFKDADEKPWDLAQLPRGSFLYPVYAPGGKTYWGVGTDKGRYETADNQRKYEPSVGAPNSNAPSIGQARVPTQRSSTTTDPFGVTSTTSSVTTPMGAPAATPSVSTPEAKAPAPKKTSAPAKTGEATKPPAQKQLDENGHIPAGAANPQLVQAANSILDGMDVDKLPIPQRDRTAAMALAQQYGWGGQGTFTPKEKVLLKEAGTFINEASNNKALTVLDSPASRARLAALIGDVNRSGTWHNLFRVAASQGATPQEIEFLRMYNQLVGTISGLGQLTRSGRITEATIGRLMQELPNPVTTQSAADAKSRLQRLKNEIAVADQSVGKNAPAPTSTAPKVRKWNQEKGDFE